MSWSKESTVMRVVIVACAATCIASGCSESNDNWNIFAKDNPRKVEPSNKESAPPRAASQDNAVAENRDRTADTATNSSSVDDAAWRGDPQRIEQYASQLQPSGRETTSTRNNGGGAPVVSSNQSTNASSGSNSMSPVRMSSVRDTPSYNGSTPLVNDTAPPARTNEQIATPNNTANSTTDITPVRPASSLDAANDGDNRPKFIDNDQLPADRTNVPPRTDALPPPQDPKATGAPKLSAVTVENAQPPVKSDSTVASVENNAAATGTAVPDQAEQLEIREQEARVAADPSNIQALFKLRMLYLLSGRESDAFATIDGIPTETQEIVLAQLRNFDAARSVSLNDPATSANAQLEAMRNLQEKLRAQADLQVPKVVLCTEILAFGKYTPFESTNFEAGYDHDVVLYVEVDNFKSEQTAGGEYRTKLAARVSMLSKDGEQLSTFVEEPNIEDLNRRPRRDFFMSFGPFTIPGVFPAGEYVIKVQVDDLLAGKTNSNKTSFKLVP